MDGHALARFLERIEVDEASGCWNWTGSPNNHGYGIATTRGLVETEKTQMLAHRVSWIVHKGPIPTSDCAHGTVVRHKCDNRLCVNPDHLEIGSQADNVRDMIVRGRKVSGTPSGVKHWNAVIRSQSDIDLICATKGKTKDLALKYGVDVCTIKRIRRRNGVVVENADKFVNKPLSQEDIDFIRSTPPGKRGLTKRFGLSKTAISKIRKGITYAP